LYLPLTFGFSLWAFNCILHLAVLRAARSMERAAVFACGFEAYCILYLPLTFGFSLWAFNCIWLFSLQREACGLQLYFVFALGFGL